MGVRVPLSAPHHTKPAYYHYLTSYPNTVCDQIVTFSWWAVSPGHRPVQSVVNR